MATKKSNNSEYDVLKEHYLHSDEVRLKLSDSFDKYLLTFSTGSLYLSINSIKDMGHINHPLVLGIGWIFLIISMLSTLLSIYWSVCAYQEGMDDAIENANRLNEGKRTIQKDNSYDKLIDFATKISIGCFILGVIVLSIFYFTNLPGRHWYGR